MSRIASLLRCSECGHVPSEMRRQVPRVETVRFVCLGQISCVTERGERTTALSLKSIRALSYVFGIMGQRVWVTATEDGEGDRTEALRVSRWIPPSGIEVEGCWRQVVVGDYLWLEVGEGA